MGWGTCINVHTEYMNSKFSYLRAFVFVEI